LVPLVLGPCLDPIGDALEILVVDDSKVMREMIVACLRGESGLSFTHAASGLEAIERLSLSSFDLVFLDLNMPDIGGFEVLEFVRGQDALSDVPIVVVTTRGDEGSRERALATGATRFMTKPFEPADILAETRSLLRSRLSTPQ
jgi:two-component system, chemotaxis family, chemotaxis protein CheY